MAQYFDPFPAKDYKAPGSKVFTKATDITRRFTLDSFILDNDVIFDEYRVRDGERPDMVAFDYYQNANLDWLILLTNQIKDPYFQWVMSYEQFNAYIKAKYGSVEYALSTVHHYEKIIQNAGEYVTNTEVFITQEKTLEIDYTTFLTLPAFSRKEVTIFDYETLKNEKNRLIYLLDARFALPIIEQHRNIFNTGNFTR